MLSYEFEYWVICGLGHHLCARLDGVLFLDVIYIEESIHCPTPGVDWH